MQTMRDKLIELLRGDLPHFENSVVPWGNKHIGELADHLIANGVTVTDNNVGGKWISVEDRLPTESGKYFVCSQFGDCDVLSYSKKHEAFNADDDLSENEIELYRIGVAHWMPLPEAPKGVDNV